MGSRMKKIVLLLLFISTFCKAQQSINEYSFIEVPDRFEFVFGDNPYRLSEMMVFYLGKNDLKAYRQSDTPNVSKCDILYADLIKGKSMFTTKLSIVLKDCNDTVLYQSPDGSSRIKTYDKSYPDALRDAFKFFSVKNIKMLPEQEKNESKVEIKENDLQIDTDTPETATKDITNLGNVPESLFTTYSNDGKSYLLKKVATGFILFLTQEDKDDLVKIGDIVLNKDALFTMQDIYGDSKSGYFNKEQDVIIELSNGKEIRYKRER